MRGENPKEERDPDHGVAGTEHNGLPLRNRRSERDAEHRTRTDREARAGPPRPAQRAGRQPGGARERKDPAGTEPRAASPREAPEARESPRERPHRRPPQAHRARQPRRTGRTAGGGANRPREHPRRHGAHRGDRGENAPASSTTSARAASDAGRWRRPPSGGASRRFPVKRAKRSARFPAREKQGRPDRRPQRTQRSRQRRRSQPRPAHRAGCQSATAGCGKVRRPARRREAGRAPRRRRRRQGRKPTGRTRPARGPREAGRDPRRGQGSGKPRLAKSSVRASLRSSCRVVSSSQASSRSCLATAGEK